ncbi:MAG TPA: bifunctional phosphoribosyl-AMP cyclohydrolase/phosphoribosyl-ATP diphosphatase HisIE [Moorella mulderi]|nr:bifunctional phosphoribosyl-AMP cyclohydrolase/phosphoribosyl-ATP diphosphatase HisIE [Moorella mulderi]
MNFLEKLRFDEKGLIPAIIQEESGPVLMLAYMNREALEKTLATGEIWFYSRSRKELWHKGATSGNYQKVIKAFYDCDGDALLFRVRQKGVACHTGRFSCFHNPLPVKSQEGEDEKPPGLGQVLEEVFGIIKERQENRPQGSYTARLLAEGQDKILKKVGEESSEVIIASKNLNPQEVVYEMADLLYHLLVLMAYHGVGLDEVARELARRLPPKEG